MHLKISLVVNENQNNKCEHYSGLLFYSPSFFMPCRSLTPASNQAPHNRLLQTKPCGKSIEFLFQLFDCLQVPIAFSCGFRRHLNWVCRLSLDHFRDGHCCGSSCFIHLLQLVIYCDQTI